MWAGWHLAHREAALAFRGNVETGPFHTHIGAFEEFAKLIYDD